MNITEKRAKLMVFMCDKYRKEAEFIEYGDYFSNLMEESGIDFDEDEYSAEFYYFLDHKLIKYKNKHNTENSQIVPTSECRDIVDTLGQSWITKNWPVILTALAKGATRALINAALNK